MKYLKLFENYDEFYKELDFQESLDWAEENKDLEPMSQSEIKYLSERFPTYEQMWVYKDKKSLTGYSLRKQLDGNPTYGINLTVFLFNKKLTIHIEKHPDEYYHITLSIKEKNKAFLRNFRYFVCDQLDGVKKFLDNEIPETV